jgi:ribosomal protein S8
MGHIYDDFMRKTKYPHLAYQEVFLSSQAEYMKIKVGAQLIVDSLGRLKIDEALIGGTSEVKKNELKENIQTEQFFALEGELKSLNGAYVDVVHMMAELDERYKADMKLLNEFEDEHRKDFYKLFAVEADKHKYDLVDILKAQAYIFDMQLWNKAKRSKSVKTHFKKSSIVGELNAKTYLKHYLSTQDSNKSSTDTKKLFELYEYPVTVQKDYILVVSATSQDAMDHETAIKDLDKSYAVESFIDEIAAIKWAMKNSVKVLALEELLSKVGGEKFLRIYAKNVLSNPKIMFISEKSKFNEVAISKLVSPGASSKVLAQNVKSIIDEES